MNAGEMVKKDIEEGSIIITDIMARNISKSSSKMINEIMEIYGEKPINEISNIVNISGHEVFRKEILIAFMAIANNAINEAKKELEGNDNIEFQEYDEAIFAALVKDLPDDLQEQLLAQSKSLVGKSLSDIESTIYFKLEQNYPRDELKESMVNAVKEYIDGPSVSNGSVISSSKVVNDARNSFFFDSKTISQIEAFQYYNNDPISKVCKHFAGLIFAPNDPLMYKITPPLHWNCKSTIIPLTKAQLNGRPIKPIEIPSAIESQIQFSESLCNCCRNLSEL